MNKIAISLAALLLLPGCFVVLAVNEDVQPSCPPPESPTAPQPLPESAPKPVEQNIRNFGTSRGESSRSPASGENRSREIGSHRRPQAPQ